MSAIQLLFKQRSFHLSSLYLAKNYFINPASNKQLNNIFVLFGTNRSYTIECLRLSKFFLQLFTKFGVTNRFSISSSSTTFIISLFTRTVEDYRTSSI